MKKLNKHPRLFKKTALTLKKLITSKVKSMRIKKIGNSLGKINKNKQISKINQIKKDIKNQNQINANNPNSMSMIKIIDPDISRR
jgi:hypothetical protein